MSRIITAFVKQGTFAHVRTHKIRPTIISPENIHLTTSHFYQFRVHVFFLVQMLTVKRFYFLINKDNAVLFPLLVKKGGISCQLK